MNGETEVAVRLPADLKEAAEKLALREGVTLDGLVAAALAERLSAEETAGHFAARRARADLAAFDRFLGRPGGASPRADDRV